MLKKCQVTLVGSHLYFTTFENVKDGDWCLHFGNAFENNNLVDKTTLVRITEPYHSQVSFASDHYKFWKRWDKNSLYRYHHDGLRKVVATTDIELWGNGIPGIPKDFITKYIMTSHEKECIKEVDIEAVQIPGAYLGAFDYNYKPILMNGCVIIHQHPKKEEKLYTRAELRAACIKAGNLCFINDKIVPTELFNNWFDKNYPQ